MASVFCPHGFVAGSHSVVLAGRLTSGRNPTTRFLGKGQAVGTGDDWFGNCISPVTYERVVGHSLSLSLVYSMAPAD